LDVVLHFDGEIIGLVSSALVGGNVRIVTAHCYNLRLNRHSPLLLSKFV